MIPVAVTKKGQDGAISGCDDGGICAVHSALVGSDAARVTEICVRSVTCISGAPVLLRTTPLTTRLSPGTTAGASGPIRFTRRAELAVSSVASSQRLPRAATSPVISIIRPSSAVETSEITFGVATSSASFGNMVTSAGLVLSPTVREVGIRPTTLTLSPGASCGRSPCPYERTITPALPELSCMAKIDLPKNPGGMVTAPCTVTSNPAGKSAKSAIATLPAIATLGQIAIKISNIRIRAMVYRQASSASNQP